MCNRGAFYRKLKSKLFKWFTRINSYRYVDALNKFITGYNDTMHSSTGMTPSLLCDKDVLHIWERMKKRQRGSGSPRLHASTL
jgi:hypothetical protein